MTLPRVGNQYRCTLRMFLFQQMRDIALVLGLVKQLAVPEVEGRHFVRRLGRDRIEQAGRAHVRLAEHAGAESVENFPGFPASCGGRVSRPQVIVSIVVQKIPQFGYVVRGAARLERRTGPSTHAELDQVLEPKKSS